MTKIASRPGEFPTVSDGTVRKRCVHCAGREVPPLRPAGVLPERSADSLRTFQPIPHQLSQLVSGMVCGHGRHFSPAVAAGSGIGYRRGRRRLSRQPECPIWLSNRFSRPSTSPPVPLSIVSDSPATPLRNHCRGNGMQCRRRGGCPDGTGQASFQSGCGARTSRKRPRYPSFACDAVFGSVSTLDTRHSTSLHSLGRWVMRS